MQNPEKLSKLLIEKNLVISTAESCTGGLVSSLLTDISGSSAYTKLNFDCSMIGIVGPNGSGKSNVIDAVKWVLGEKSIKSLRGKKSDDVIFHGSKTKPANDFAEVTLTFDNSKRVLHIDLDEVSITRRLYRGNGNNDYFINGEQARLKDIMDVFVDTGLSKGSLGIISQGTVN